jgi:hypothetical protein
VLQDLDTMAKEQMNRVERAVTAKALRGLAGALVEDERVEELFGGQVNRRQSVIALTDRRLLVCDGTPEGSIAVDYPSIEQIDRRLTKLEIHGAGVELTIKSAARRDTLALSLRERQSSVPAPERQTSRHPPPPRVPEGSTHEPR